MKRLVIGLGNPGAEYEATRHNIGWQLLDAYAKRVGGLEWRDKPRFEATLAETGGIGLAKPQTYMNESGRAAQHIASYFKLPSSALLVVSDDIDLPFGQVRFRKSGGSGGQKGLADIITVLGTEDVPRLRVGIGEPPVGNTATEYVLSGFSPAEREELPAVLDAAVDELEKHL